MAKSTRLQVLDAARSHLGADAAGGSAVFTDAILAPHFNAAYRQLYRIMSQVQNPYVEAEAFYNLPAYTSSLPPSVAGITNMGEPLDVWDRGNVTSAAVNAVAIAGELSIITTDTPHGLTLGQQFIVYGVGGVSGISGTWTAHDVPSLVGVEIHSVASSGVYTSGGTLTHSPDDFGDPLFKRDYIDSLSPARGGSLAQWAWTGDVFRFMPSTEIRQIRVLYTISGEPPTVSSDIVGIDDAIDALAYRTAGLVAASRGNPHAAELNSIALGPTFAQTGEVGGLYLELLQSGVRAMQGERWRRPPFRPRRDAGGVFDY